VIFLAKKKTNDKNKQDYAENDNLPNYEGVTDELVEKLFKKYGANKPTEEEMKMSAETYIRSREYKIFTKREENKWVRRYEKWCAKAQKILPVSVTEEEKKIVNKAIEISDLKVTPEGVASFSFIVFAIFLVFSLITALISPLFMILFAVIGYAVFNYLKKYPKKAVENAQVKASGETILAVLYLVIYMRHTPNMEAAVKFASDNLTGPLANSFRKLLWDVQSRKYKNISEALDAYTKEWGEFNKPFTDAIYLIESSMYQTKEEHRKDLLNRALDRILDGTFERMSTYAHSLKTPVDTIYTMGIILPVLGLVMFPMLAAFMSDMVKPQTIAIFYNIMLPIFVLFFEKLIFMKRPVGFPTPDISNHPDMPKKGCFKMGGKNVKAWPISLLILLIGVIPFIMYLTNAPSQPSEKDIFISLLPIFGIAFSIWFYTKNISAPRLKILKKVTSVEKELADALFQLGMRIGEGNPPEIAVQKVAAVMRESETAMFFKKITVNMKRLGYSFERAIFDENYGAILFYPSPMLKSVMEVLVSSSNKSLEVAAVSMINIARYLQNIGRINDKVVDILSDTVSGIKFQASVITPIVSGVVVGLTSLIIIILSLLSSKMEELSALSGGDLGPWALGMFSMSGSVPLYLFQPIVGIYLIEIVLLIGSLDADIETNGHPLYRNNIISKLILPAVIIYAIVGVALTVIFGGLGKAALAIGGSFGV